MLFLVLITVIVSSPRFSTNSRCWSGLTAYTGHLPAGIAGSVVLLEISIGVATPFGSRRPGRKVARHLRAVSATFWLMTYSRWPARVGDPAINTGMVAGLAAVATGIASLNACGDP